MHIIFAMTKNSSRTRINEVADVSSTLFRQFLCIPLIFVYLLTPSFCTTAGANMAEETGKSFAQRDWLLEIESQVRKWWEDGDVFRPDAKDSPSKPCEKLFGNFPFPYMNGYLHLGHAFSFSKLEFAAAYHRLRGANVLLPFAFHCTRMPIKVSADKFSREINMPPPDFPMVKEEESGEPEGESEGNLSQLGGSFKGKKLKTVAISGGQVPMGDCAELWFA